MRGVLFGGMVLQILSAVTRKHTMEEQNILKGRGQTNVRLRGKNMLNVIK